MLLTIAVLVLAGISLAQFWQLRQQQGAREQLKDEILAELRAAQPGDRPGPGGTEARAQAGADAANVSPAAAPEPAPPPTPLAATEYWISTDYSDQKPHGYSVWLETVPGGHFIAERCDAPAYSSEVRADRLPFEDPVCETLSDTRVHTISETNLQLAEGGSLPMTLATADGSPVLNLEWDHNRITLHPGQKNTLWEGLQTLPSVRQAQQAAWDRYNRLRAGSE